MRIKTVDGEVREIPIGGSLGGMAVTEATLTVKDVNRLREPGAGEWLTEMLLMRLVKDQ